jgi:hypothetical protein
MIHMIIIRVYHFQHEFGHYRALVMFRVAVKEASEGQIKPQQGSKRISRAHDFAAGKVSFPASIRPDAEFSVVPVPLLAAIGSPTGAAMRPPGR